MIMTKPDSFHFGPTNCYETDNPTTSAMVWLMYSTNIYQVTPVDIYIELDTVLLSFSTYLLNLEAAEPVIDQGKLAHMDEEMVQYIADYELASQRPEDRHHQQRSE